MRAAALALALAAPARGAPTPLPSAAPLTLSNDALSVTIDPTHGLTSLHEKKAAEGKPLALALSTDGWAASLTPGAPPDASDGNGTALAAAPGAPIELSSASCAAQPATASGSATLATLHWECAAQGYSVTALYALPTDGGAFLTKTLRIAAKSPATEFTVASVTPWTGLTALPAGASAPPNFLNFKNGPRSPPARPPRSGCVTAA